MNITHRAILTACQLSSLVCFSFLLHRKCFENTPSVAVLFVGLKCVCVCVCVCVCGLGFTETSVRNGGEHKKHFVFVFVRLQYNIYLCVCGFNGRVNESCTSSTWSPVFSLVHKVFVRWPWQPHPFSFLTLSSSSLSLSLSLRQQQPHGPQDILDPSLHHTSRPPRPTTTVPQKSLQLFFYTVTYA